MSTPADRPSVFDSIKDPVLRAWLESEFTEDTPEWGPDEVEVTMYPARRRTTSPRG